MATASSPTPPTMPPRAVSSRPSPTSTPATPVTSATSPPAGFRFPDRDWRVITTMQVDNLGRTTEETSPERQHHVYRVQRHNPRTAGLSGLGQCQRHRQRQRVNDHIGHLEFVGHGQLRRLHDHDHQRHRLGPDRNGDGDTTARPRHSRSALPSPRQPTPPAYFWFGAPAGRFR